MKLYSKNFILTGVLVFLLCIRPQVTVAIGPEIPDPDTPIDGGIGLLVAAGAAYGVKKIRALRKRKSEKLP